MATSNITANPFPSEVNLGINYGPIIIGGFIEASLWGMVVIQTVIYFMVYGGTDKWQMKTAVIINFILATIDVIGTTYAIYVPLILHFGNVAELSNWSWGIRVANFTSGITIFHIHCFFLVRVYRFSRSRISLAIAAPFIIATFVLVLITDSEVVVNPNRSDVANLKNILSANEAMIAATDFILAALLTINLRKREIRMSRRTSTNVVIGSLIKYTIGTGTLTGLLALIAFILPYIMPEKGSSYSNAIYASLPHTYANAMLIILNSRRIVAKPLHRYSVPQKPMSSLVFNDISTSYAGRTKKTENIPALDWSSMHILPREETPPDSDHWTQQLIDEKDHPGGDVESGCDTAQSTMSFAPPEIAEPEKSRPHVRTVFEPPMKS